MNDADEIQKELDPIGLSCVLETFQEYDLVMEMIDNLGKLIPDQMSHLEKEHDKFLEIFKQYQEQPHLLDKKLDDMLVRCLTVIRDPFASIDHKNAIFEYLYIIVNVRGFKTIIRHLPHEVADFELVLHLLEQQNPVDATTWTTRYILLLWMSIVIMIPFHMAKFDAFVPESAPNEKTTMTRILEICQTYIVVPDKCRDAAAYLAAKFLTRSDVKERHMDIFIQWCMNSGADENASVFVRYGTLSVLAMVLKHGKREDMLPYAKPILAWITKVDFIKSAQSGEQKLACKITQRVGLTFLPTKIAAWRYNRGNRSLASNLSSGDGSVAKTDNCCQLTESPLNDCDDDIPEEIEEVIDQLMQAIRATDSIVRWSAAKGLGRVTGRLPKDLADDVVETILELFTPRETDSGWHGGCLALAELGRRGLLLPQRLPQVVPIVLKALEYDEARGYSSVGSHIRDAACYVCWAFARAYEVDVLEPFVPQIAAQLLVVTCFDREINCRRAASAAFQENVGRQGTFPHGIDILTTADFFAVSGRQNAYLNVSKFIAQFPEYTNALIEHLMKLKVDHWDVAIRDLTARALHALTPLATQYMIETVIPNLLQRFASVDLYTRHGSIISLGAIIHALKIADSKVPDNYVEKCKDIISTCRERQYFRGLGGELMRQACSQFIGDCANADLPFHNSPVIDDWLLLLNECLCYDLPAVRAPALTTFPLVVNAFYQQRSDLQASLIKVCTKNVQDQSNEILRMSYSLLLGTLPRFMLLENVDVIINSLVTMLVITPTTTAWAESRRHGMLALTSIMNTLEEDVGSGLAEDHLRVIFENFLAGMSEYTQNKHGDIGAWVRGASINGLEKYVDVLTSRAPHLLTEEIVHSICINLPQQAVERIDRTRGLAAKLFSKIVHATPKIPHIPHHDELIKIVPYDASDTINWNLESFAFPKFVKLLQFPTYTSKVLLGLITSIGGMTESLVMKSSNALFDELKRLRKTTGDVEMYRLCAEILKIFEEYKGTPRVTTAMLRFIEKLLCSGCVSTVMEDTSSEFAQKSLKLIQHELNGCRDIYKLMDGISALCPFIQINSQVGSTALAQLSIMLCHRQAYVRKSTAARLHESLLIYGDNGLVPEDNLEQILNLLSSTNWQETVEVVKPVRNELCNLMGIRVPIAKKKVIEN